MPTTIARPKPRTAVPPRTALKRTKILATLGPASTQPDVLKALLESGANAVRLNCSHASLDELTRSVKLVRRCSAELETPVAIMLDLQGPRLRTGRLRNGEPVMLKAGSTITITTEDVPGTESIISTNYRDLPKKVARGNRILLDEGNLELQVVRPNSHEVTCEVVVGGLLKEHKGINLPRIDIDMPAVTLKDRQDLEWGLKLGVDYVALSFVRDADDILNVRKTVRARKEHTLVVAKIERPEAIENIDGILDASDGIMVARGDLAVELSASDVPVIQKQLVGKANGAGKLVIVATQMLESMINHQHPTRAEASDVANAIFDGADAVMLSGETAVGLFPVAAVKVMSEIIAKAEASAFAFREAPVGLADDPERGGHAHALAQAARACLAESHAKAVCVFTLTGWSARIMAKYRPPVPIYALTPVQKVLEQLSLQWGIVPLLAPLDKTTDRMIARGEQVVLHHGLLKRGDIVLVTAGGTAKHRASNMMKILPLGGGYSK